MSNNPTPPAPRALMPGDRTPGGSVVLVPATPPQSMQNSAFALATPVNTGNLANLSLTPFVVNDTLDMLSPNPYIHGGLADEQYTPPTADHASGAGNGTTNSMHLAAQMIGAMPPTNEAQRLSTLQQLRRFVPAHVLANQYPAPIQGQPPAALPNALAMPLNEHDLNVGHAADAQEHQGGVWPPLNTPEENNAPPVFPAPMQTDAHPATHETGVSVWGSALARADTPSPSPLSFDLDTPTPTGPRRGGSNANGAAKRDTRAALTTTMTAPTAREGAPVFQTNGAAIQSEPTSNGSLSVQNGGERGVGSLPRADSAGSIDYFSHFTTPPPFADPSQTDRGQRAAGAPLVAVHDALACATTATAEEREAARVNNDVAMDVHAALPAPAGASRMDGPSTTGANPGEQLCVPVSLDDPPTLRKRPWAGSPNMEDLQRALRRPRWLDSTRDVSPAGAALPNSLSSGSNPWRSERRDDETAWDDRSRGTGSLFVPVASSTPTSRTVRNISNRSPLGLQSTSDDAMSRPNSDHDRARTRRDEVPHRVAPLLLSAAATHPAPAPPSMDVDPVPDEHDASPQEGQKRNKGKGRATAQEPEAPDAADDRPGPEQDVWDELQLTEARLQSRRQMHADRQRRIAGEDERASMAGPSRLPAAQGERRPVEHQTFQETPRDVHPSRAPGQDLLDARGAGEQAERVRPSAWGSIHRTREPSCFRPLPNTRAAAYMAAASTDRRPMATPPLTQRPQHWREYSTAGPILRSPVTNARYPDQSPGSARDEDEWMASEQGQYEQPGSGEDQTHVDFGAGGWHEDGEIIPSALRSDVPMEDDRPTEPPSGGFPRVHRDDPETATRGMATEWIREIWADPANSTVLIEVYNYRYSEDDELNRRISDCLRWAFEQLSGDCSFDVVPPEPADGVTRRSRDRPTLWAIRGLPARTVARVVAQGVWSFNAITFIATPRAVTLPSWLFMLEGYLNDNTEKIRNAILRVLTEDGMWEWIAQMTSTNPDFAGMTADEAVADVLDSIRVDTFQLTNGNHIANVRVLRSPTRSMREWRRWVAALRARRYPSFANGTGRVRYIAPCSGCRSVSHLTHLCPYPLTRGWNGPFPGEGVFGERRRGDEENDPRAAYGGCTQGRQRERTDRRGYQHGDHRPQRRNDRRDEREGERPRGGRQNGRDNGPRRGGALSGPRTGQHENTRRNSSAGPSTNRRGNPDARGRRPHDRGNSERKKY
ncbi:hypothetical protein K466DRAFT_569690 [Polyporus arcularius HHB13444]|uniref:Uncharacterized protein n=1 Tax=Polyporus arcularius HHB13444 TaxID=1314778 RepID=A0A5C3NWJ2_9APHY|nr:hypothetical protein K466DRAFT_569690 [Polyporus arcularius HHB13444]